MDDEAQAAMQWMIDGLKAGDDSVERKAREYVEFVAREGDADVLAVVIEALMAAAIEKQ